MSEKIRCRLCNRTLKARKENFPMALFSKADKGEKQKVVGYACRYCIKKYDKQDFIKKHNIKANPGQRIADAIREKIEQLKTHITKEK